MAAQEKLTSRSIGLPILGHCLLLGDNPRQDLYCLPRKHGPIMHLRLGFLLVIITSPAGAELVLETHGLIFTNRPHNEAAKYISYNQRSVVFGRYSLLWRNMRKLCMLELLSQLRISQFRPMRNTEVRALITSVKQAAVKQETVDISARVSALNEDMICLMVFGRKDKYQDLDDTGFKPVVMETLNVAAVFNLGDYFLYLGVLDLQCLTHRMKRLSKIFDGFLEKIIDDHLHNKTEN